MSCKITADYKAWFGLIICIFIVLGDCVSVFSSADELASVFFILYILILIAKKRICRKDFFIMTGLVLICILGIISTLSSGLVNNNMAVVIDALWLFKVFSGYIGFKYIFITEKSKINFISVAVFLSKIFIIVSFFGALANLVIDIGLSDGTVRYGIRAYSFIMGNSGHYGMTAACCFGFILADKTKKIKQWIYLGMVTVNIVTTTKLMPMIVILIYFILKYQKEIKKIKIQYMILAVIVVCFFGFNQIRYYITDLNHPRMRLMIYGIRTAISYFPFGSGFATYGSEMAKRYYSPLYTTYGFENFYGLSPTNSSCLNDNYIAMIMAQFGVVALFIFGEIMYLLFKQIFHNTDFKSVEVRNIAAGLYVSMLATALMSGTFKGAIGMLSFMTIGFLCSLKKDDGMVKNVNESKNHK